ncbi:MAG: WbqC family protein [Paludibacter sp.]
MQKDDPKPPNVGSNVCLSIAYLAPIEYYIALAKADTVFLEYCEHYEKQSYRNRCTIAAANGKMALTIPVEKMSGAKVLTKDIRISQHNDWQIQHWRSIESAYNSTPFFEYYKDDLFPFYERNWEFLWDFNNEIQTKVFELLEIQPEIRVTEQYQTSLNLELLDLRKSIHPKTEIHLQNFKSYYQVFEQRFGFQPNLSIIDLLFNMGNEAQIIIKN